jgi:hypothetical protein
MRSVEFHPEAAAEFLAAVQFYEVQAEKLGFDFVSAVQRAAERIVEYPKQRCTIRSPSETGSDSMVSVRPRIAG